MKVIQKGYKHMAYECETKCAWCDSSLRFFIDKGDKRVSRYKDHYDYIRFICPICGERNSNVNGHNKGGFTDIKVNRVPITIKEYEEEIKNLSTEEVDLSEDDIYWLKGGKEQNYIYCKEEES